MKVVINRCFGGFSLSDAALAMLGSKGSWEYDDDNKRADVLLANTVEFLGDDANGAYASLEVVEIPNNATDWMIDEYDGNERIIYVVDGNLHFI